MRNLLYCRRTFAATLGMLLLAGLGIHQGMDVAHSIAAIAMGLAAANSYEKASEKKPAVRRGGS